MQSFLELAVADVERPSEEPQIFSQFASGFHDAHLTETGTELNV